MRKSHHPNDDSPERAAHGAQMPFLRARRALAQPFIKYCDKESSERYAKLLKRVFIGREKPRQHHAREKNGADEYLRNSNTARDLSPAMLLTYDHTR